MQEEAFAGNRGVHDRIGWSGEKKPKPASECSKFEGKSTYCMICMQVKRDLEMDIESGARFRCPRVKLDNTKASCLKVSLGYSTVIIFVVEHLWISQLRGTPIYECPAGARDIEN